MRPFRFALVLSFLIVLVPIASAWEQDAVELCEPKGIPIELVKAIAQVESSSNPNALNVKMNGSFKSFLPEFTETAISLLREITPITHEVGIGLMQIHYKIWGPVYQVSPTELLGVRKNLEVGCDILSNELAKTGSLAVRIGRYHSRTPALNAAYSRKVLYALSHPSH